MNANPTPPRFNPFPGLRSFRSDEDHLFFGREEQTVELVSRLQLHRFIAVVGSSGRGKSSLVRCGLLSRLQGGGMSGAGAHWEIAVMHPGGDPLRHLAEALFEAGLYDRAVEDAVPQLLATLGRSQFGLVEAVRQAALPAGRNFLLVVDQFEEIFRYDEAGAAESERANDFIAMLREACAQSGVAIYVVVTMRSDFIGDCSRFDGLAEAVNRGEYLIPRLSREQFKSAIEGPIRVAGGQIAPRLLQRLLNDVGEEQDQLPCLQHALMRTWRVWQGRAKADALDLDDYAQVGKMSQALSLHADEVYAALATDRQRQLCAAMFQALTVEGSEKRGIRRPRRLQTLCRILEVEKAELLPVVDAFRQPEVSFLLPGSDVELRDTTVIDLSHESLMRVWMRLRAWVDEEAQSVGIFRRLSESAALWRQGHTGLCRDPELAIARAWRETKRPNAAWAEQTTGNFAEAMAYLQASTDAAEAEVRQREAQARAEATRKTRRLRWIIGGLTAVVLALCAAGVSGLRARQQEFARASRLDAGLASRLLEEGKTSEGIAYLVRAAQKDPHNPFVPRRLAALLTSRNFLIPEAGELGHASAIDAAGYSGDGKNLSVLWMDGTLIKTDLTTGRREEDHMPRSTLVTRPTRNFFLIPRTDNSIAVIDQHTGEVARTVPFPDRISSILSPGVNTPPSNTDFAVVLLRNRTVLVCDVATGQFVGEPIPAPPGATADLYFVTGGDGVAWGESGGTIRFRQLHSGVETSLQPRPGATFFDFSISPTGDQAVTVEDFGTNRPRELRRWALPAGTPQGEALVLARATGNGWTYFSPDGAFILTWYGVLEIFEAASGRRIAALPTTRAFAFRHPWFLPGGRSFATTSGGVVQVWDLHTGQSRGQPMRHTGAARVVGVSSDGATLLTVCSDGYSRVWDTETGKLITEPTLQQRGMTPAALSPDGTRMAVTTREGAVHQFRLDRKAADTPVLPRTPPVLLQPWLSEGPARLWWMKADRAHVIDVASGRDLPGGVTFPETILGFDTNAAGARARPDVKVMVVRTTSLRWAAWWLAEGKISRDFTLAEAPAVSANISFSRSGDRVALIWPLSTATAQFRVWDLTTGQPVGPVTSVRTNYNGLLNLSLSPDGGLIALPTLPDSATVFDAATGKETLKLTAGSPSFTGAFFTPDGARIVTTHTRGDGQIWNAKTGEAIGPPLYHNDSISSAVFSPDGGLVATRSSDGHVKLWNTHTGEAPGEFAETFNGPVRDVAFSRDGTLLTAASDDGSVRNWDLTTMLPLTDMLAPEGRRLTSTEFSPDARFLRTGGFGTVYLLWSIPPPLPAGAVTPPWLLDLATACAGKTATAEGKFIPAANAAEKIAGVRRALASLPDDAPYVEWGRWFLADRATRSIAPGFTMTSAEAEKLAKEMANAPAIATPSPSP